MKTTHIFNDTINSILSVATIIMALLFLNNSLNAQPAKFIWAKGSGATNNDGGSGVVIDALGNSIVTGYFRDTVTFGSISLTNIGNTNIFTVKYDPSGNVLWARQSSGTAQYNFPFDIAIDRSGNTIIIGYFNGKVIFDGITLTSSGNSDIFIVKYDPSGNVLWARQSCGADAGCAFGIATDSFDNIIITGRFGGTATFDTTKLTSAGGIDIFIAKYDVSGNVLWAKRAGGTNNDVGSSIATDSSGNSIIFGNFEDTVTFDTFILTSAGMKDLFIAKYDVSGNVLWAKQAGGTGYAHGRSIAIDRLGNIMVTGEFYDNATFGTTTLISTEGWDSDVFIVKYDSSGNVIWIKQVYGTNYDFGCDIAMDRYNNYLITGSFQGTAIFDTVTFTTAGNIDIFIAKYSASGNLLWAKRAGGASTDYVEGIATDGLGNSIITGSFEGTTTLGTITMNSAGLSDIFIAKLQEIPDPYPPQNFIATPGNRKVTLSWMPIAEVNVSHYIVYCSQKSGFIPTSNDSIARVNHPDSTYIHSGLKNGTTYYYRLSTVNGTENESDFSEEVSATPSAPDLYIPFTQYDFGDVAVDSSKLWILRLKNLGTDTLLIYDINWRHPQFYLNNTSGVIIPNDSLSIEVTFKPKAPITYEDSLIIITDMPDDAIVKVFLTGRGITQQIVTVLPNPFTPNNDRYNDYVEFKYPEMSTKKPVIKIFNIRGYKINELKDFSNYEYRWYGKDDNGKELEPGVYIYILELHSKNIASGTIILIR